MINSLGVGSGLELGSLLENLVSVERASQERLLDGRHARARVSLSSLGTLRASVDSLASAVTALQGFELGLTVDSTNADAVSATASDEADQGSYLIDVDQIAAAQSLATDGASPFADADAGLGEGTLTLTVGETSVDIELASGQNSLRDVRDAINASGVDIQAALVQDGDAYRLLLTSGRTGTAGTMTLSVDGTIDTRLASANMDETAAAADALFSVNGLQLGSSANTIEDVLPGLTLELKAATDTAPAGLTVSTDSAALGEKLAAMVTAYNGLVTNMKKLGGASPDGRAAGPLVGDASLRALQRQVGGVFADRVETEQADNPFTSLVSIGVKTSLSGSASVDTGDLEAAMQLDPAGVEALVGAFAARFAETLDAFEGSGGIFGHRTEQLNAELKRIGRERDALELRLAAMEERLRKRFSALDSLVNEFQSTSTYLAQQLASLSSLNP